MALAGYTPEAIAKVRKREDKPVVVESWNMLAVRCFSRCGLKVQVGMAGAHYMGVEAIEVESVARALRLDYNEDLLWAVQVMAGAASEGHNRNRPAPVRRR